MTSTVTTPDTTPPPSESLFEQIGGQPAVDAAVEQLYERILDDDALAPYFDGRSAERVKVHQRAFIAAALGGPARVAGPTMHDAHRHLRVTPHAFAAVVTHLVATLRSLGVARELIDAIAAALAPLEREIVTGERS